MNLRARYLNKTFTGVPFSLLNTTILAGKFQLLLDKFAGAAAAYSLRALSKDSTNVVKVRRDSDNAERDFTATEVSDGTLEAWAKGTLSTTAPADYGSGAAAAYSLRIVSDSYTGPVVKVRRSDDNAEADFTAEEVSDGTLLAWVGTTASDDGFVTTWYDQSGNSNDATQATAASQPKIVDAGVLVTENGKAALGFTFAESQTMTFSLTLNQPFEIYHVLKLNNRDTGGDDTQYILDAANNSDPRVIVGKALSTDVYRIFAGSALDNTAHSEDQILRSSVFNGASSSYYVDGGLITSGDAGSNNFNGDYRISGINNNVSYFWDGTLQEFIIYADQSANRADIEGDINDYYGIYTAPSGFVTTWYDQSGNSNDATQATAASQPKIVDAGVLVTENGKAAVRSYGVPNSYALATAASINISLDNLSILSVQTQYISDHASRYFTINDQVSFVETSPSNTPPINRYFGDVITAQNTNSDFFLNTQQIFTLLSDNTVASSKLYQDGVLISDNTGSTISASVSNGSVVLFNRLSQTNGADQTLQELILYPSDQSANRVLIERNIASYYGITLS